MPSWEREADPVRASLHPTARVIGGRRILGLGRSLVLPTDAPRRAAPQEGYG